LQPSEALCREPLLRLDVNRTSTSPLSVAQPAMRCRPPAEHRRDRNRDRLRSSTTLRSVLLSQRRSDNTGPSSSSPASRPATRNVQMQISAMHSQVRARASARGRVAHHVRAYVSSPRNAAVGHAFPAARSRERPEAPTRRPGGLQGRRLRPRSDPPDQGTSPFARWSTRQTTSSPRASTSRRSTGCIMR
jgi:hypothetical protein